MKRQSGKGGEIVTLPEKLIKARGMESRKSVAAAIGISLSALQMYETGKRRPSDNVKVKLAEHYRTTVQDLFFAD